MPRLRWRSLRVLLVCALLALTSVAPRPATGWFESVVQIAAFEVAARVIAEPPVEGQATSQQAAEAAAEPRAAAAPAVIAAPPGGGAAPPATRPEPPTRLYLVHCALLC